MQRSRRPYLSLTSFCPDIHHQICSGSVLSCPAQVQCRITGEATLLVLTRPQFSEMVVNYPEQQDVIVSNILATFGLDTKGQSLPGWTADGREDDEAFALLRQMVVQAVSTQLDALQNQFTYAVNMGEVDTVKNLIRQGVDVNTSNYDHSR